MRSRAILLCATAALTLAACSKKEEGGVTTSAPAVAADAVAPDAEAAAAPNTAIPALLPMPQLAYAYRYGLTAPPDAVRKLMSKHEAVCWAAGPTVCQVVGSNISEEGKDQLHATLTLRAQPQWLRTFRAGLDDDTRAAGGRPVAANTASEDLATDITDTEAAIRAKVILRDRLEDMLRTRRGKLSELLEAEQQLAVVRGEIDAARSQAAQMKGRVAGSTITIDYQSAGVLAPSGTFAPIGRAAEDVVGILVATLAFLIRAAAILGPVGGIAWLGWRAFRTPSRPRKPVTSPPA